MDGIEADPIRGNFEAVNGREQHDPRFERSCIELHFVLVILCE